MFGRNKEVPNGSSPEREKRYQIGWVVENNVAVIRPNQSLSWLKQSPILHPGEIGDAIRELSQAYKINSLTSIPDPGYGSSVRNLFVVVDSKTQTTE